MSLKLRQAARNLMARLVLAARHQGVCVSLRLVTLPMCTQCTSTAHLRRLCWEKVSGLGVLGVGPIMRTHRPIRIMQVGTAPMRTLRVTTTSSACWQALALYPANLEKHHPSVCQLCWARVLGCRSHRCVTPPFPDN